MKKQISPKIVSLIFAILVICFAIAFYAFSWTGPTADPPGGNVPPPLNVSGDPQTKTGSLRLGGLSVDNDTWLAISAGNVGIGTPSPSQKLDVSGQIHATGDICTDLEGGVCLSTNYLQRRVTGTCAVGSSIRAISSTGTVTCEPDDVGLQCTTRTASGTPTATAVCIGSEIITGGGCRVNSAVGWVQSSYFSGNNYVCSSYPVAYSVTVYARCCQ